jgi:hypothetical protein
MASDTASHEEVKVAGERFITYLYGGGSEDCLNAVRYHQYMQHTAKSTRHLQPEKLPPTEDAAAQHSYRVHLQVLQWKPLKTSGFTPEEWGWCLTNGKLMPVSSTLAAAPDDILNVVRCKCKNESHRQCGTQLCSCRKHGLKCVTACKNCTGTCCENCGDSTVDLFADEMDGEDISECSANEVLFDIAEGDDNDLELFIPWVHEEMIVCN